MTESSVEWRKRAVIELRQHLKMARTSLLVCGVSESSKVESQLEMRDREILFVYLRRSKNSLIRHEQFFNKKSNGLKTEC